MPPSNPFPGERDPAVRLALDIADGPERPDQFVISESVGHLVVVTARLFDRRLARRLKGHRVPIGQWPFLLFLWASENLSQRELSRLMAIEEATVTNTLDRMVRDGLITKERGRKDLRRNRLRLTDRARELQFALIPEARAVVEQALGGFSAEEVSMLTGLLKRIKKNLAREES